MLNKILLQNTDNLYRQRTFFLLLSFLLLISNALLSVKIFTSDTKVILTPFVSQKMEIGKNKVSSSYLNSIAAMHMSMLMDLNESNIDIKKDFILQNSTDSNYRDMCSYFDHQSETIKKHKISTFFIPQKWTANEGELTLFVEGLLSSRFGHEGKETKKIKCKMEFELVSGVLKLKRFEPSIEEGV